MIRIDSDHFNSEEDFVNTQLIFVRNGRFQPVGGVFTYDLKTCAFRLTETPNVTTAPDPGHPYGRIIPTVAEKVEWEDDRANCDAKKVPRPFVRTFRAVYRWNAQRQAFVTTSRD